MHRIKIILGKIITICRQFIVKPMTWNTLCMERANPAALITSGIR